jgi:hypothetical protein
MDAQKKTSVDRCSDALAEAPSVAGLARAGETPDTTPGEARRRSGEAAKRACGSVDRRALPARDVPRDTPDHVYFTDAQGRFTQISRGLARWMGVESEADALGLTDFDFFADEHASRTRR